MKILLLVCAVVAYGQDDLARGKKLYEGFCSLCHGQTGTGGKGPNLAQPRLARAPDEESLTDVIQHGIRGTEMPGFWQLTDHEAKQLAMYVRSLGQIAVEKVPGDVARGQALYASRGCAACHIVRGSGTALGPELTEIGARRNAAYLRESIVNPGAAVPERFGVVNVGLRASESRAVKGIRGIRVNEDTFTIQIRDANGRLWSFRKADLASIHKEPHASLMPAYDKLSPAELDDLIAYLASLRGDS